MSPIISTLAGASARGYGGLRAAAGAGPSFESIATGLGDGVSSSMSFTSIPNTFKHLQIRATIRSSRPAIINNFHMRINNDGTTQMSTHSMFFSPTISTGSTLNYTTGTITDYIYFPATSTSSTNFGQCIIDIFDYNHANKYKTIVAFGGTASASPNNRSAYNTYSWQSSAPITRLDFFGSSSSGFEVNTTIALYGIKG